MIKQTEYIKNDEFDFDGYPLINDLIRGGLNRYVFHNIEAGDFLTACLEGNVRAILYADDWNSDGKTFYQIISFIYNRVPSNLWGSPEIVKEHLAKREVNK